MDTAIADTINRRTADDIARNLDLIDFLCGVPGTDATPWHRSNMASAFLDDDGITNSHRAWLLGALAVKTDIGFDGVPADCDWDNLFQHFRNAISARRDPKTPPARAVAIQPCGVV